MHYVMHYVTRVPSPMDDVTRVPSPPLTRTVSRITIQVVMAVVLQDVSLIAGFSFAMTGLLMVIGPLIMYQSVDKVDRR